MTKNISQRHQVAADVSIIYATERLTFSQSFILTPNVSCMLYTLLTATNDPLTRKQNI